MAAAKKQTTLPKSLIKHAQLKISVDVCNAPRKNQSPEKFDVDIENDYKNYDDMNTWSGELKGTVENIWKAITKEDYGVNVSDIESAIKTKLFKNKKRK